MGSATTPVQAVPVPDHVEAHRDDVPVGLEELEKGGMIALDEAEPLPEELVRGSIEQALGLLVHVPNGAGSVDGHQGVAVA